MNEFYKFRCEADSPTEAELLIFAAIGDWEDMGEVSAKAFARSLADLPKSVRRIDIHINSPGGSLFEASAIYSRLADHKSEKIVYVDGLAASAASIVAMVGHKVYMRANSTMMIHLPQGIAIGNADDMRKMAGALDTVSEGMLNVYAKRTAMPRDEIRAMLAAETWMSPDEAVAKGFADEVRGVVKAAASLGDHRYIFNGTTFDLSRFHNIPAFSAKPQGVTMPKPKAVTATNDEPTPTPTPTPDPSPNPAPTPTPVPKPVAAKKKDDDEEDDDDDEKMMKKKAKGVVEEAIRQERARISALQKLDRPATHKVVMEAIADGRTAGDIVDEVMEAMEKTNRQDARRRDASILNGIPPSTTDVPDGDRGTPGFGTLIKEKVQARIKQRRLPVHGRN